MDPVDDFWDNFWDDFLDEICVQNFRMIVFDTFQSLDFVFCKILNSDMMNIFFRVDQGRHTVRAATGGKIAKIEVLSGFCEIELCGGSCGALGMWPLLCRSCLQKSTVVALNTSKIIFVKNVTMCCGHTRIFWVDHHFHIFLAEINCPGKHSNQSSKLIFKDRIYSSPFCSMFLVC